MTHLLVTNDFPPKVGGIQSYLWELWRRLSPERFAVLTIEHPRAAAFDATSGMDIERLDVPVLVPGAKLRRRINSLARDVDASLVILDPALPLGEIGRSLERPYALVLHGAEVTVPARVPFVNQLLRRVLVGADLLIAAGSYPAREARHLVGEALPTTIVVPPGVDTHRFVPLTPAEREVARRRLQIPDRSLLVVSVSRLVPRKGMDVLIEAAAKLRVSHADMTVLIGGTGRDASRLGDLAYRLGAPVRFLGRVDDELLPLLYGAADLSVMLCRDRWLGLEQEGFGIVFLEAAAAGVAQVAGRSGGVSDAVVDRLTGLVVDRPADLFVATNAIESLLDDPQRRQEMGTAGRQRAVSEFDYHRIADKLGEELAAFGA